MLNHLDSRHGEPIEGRTDKVLATARISLPLSVILISNITRIAPIGCQGKDLSTTLLKTRMGFH